MARPEIWSSQSQISPEFPAKSRDLGQSRAKARQSHGFGLKPGFEFLKARAMASGPSQSQNITRISGGKKAGCLSAENNFPIWDLRLGRKLDE
jgi:hypothetical protein